MYFKIESKIKCSFNTFQAHYKPPDPNLSLWDAIEKPVEIKRRCDRDVAVKMCKTQTLYTLKDGKIVELGDKYNRKEAKPVEQTSGLAFVSGDLPLASKRLEITSKLSEEEIRKYPRFQNYQRGEISLVSKTYLTNLKGTKIIINRQSIINDNLVLLVHTATKLELQCGD